MSSRFVCRDPTWLASSLRAGILAGACIAATGETNAQNRSTANDTLGIVKQLIDGRPVTPEKVLRATGIRLDRSDRTEVDQAQHGLVRGVFLRVAFRLGRRARLRTLQDERAQAVDRIP